MTRSEIKGSLSSQVLPIDLPGARKSVPPRALIICLLAMAAAVWGALADAKVLAGYDAISWLLLLIPAFLLAYYRGWNGAMQALAAGTGTVLLIELVAEYVWGFEVEWVFLFYVAVTLVAIGLGLGLVSELLQRERIDALVLAYSDPLTGLPNRRLLDFMLGKEFAAARRGRPLSVVLFDVDEFKAYNDRYGHREGDTALKRIASILDRNTRHMNVTGRYGGEEFLSILSGERAEGAWVFTERTREAVAEAELPTGARLSISAGIASYDPSVPDPQTLLERVDQALRRAKLAGRDRTVCAPVATGDPEVPKEFAGLSAEARLALERAQQQRAMEEAELRYHNLFNGVPVGVYQSHPSGQVLDANPALVDMLGYPDKQALLAVTADYLFVDAGERERWRSLMQRDGVVGDFEMQLRRKDDSMIWVRDSARAVFDREGNVKYYEGVLEDITERKRTELALREANEKLQAAIRATPLAMMTLDDHGSLTSWNPAAERIFGWREDEVIGRPPPFVRPEDEAEFRRYGERVLGGEALNGIDLRRQRRDGALLDVKLWAAPLRDGEGEVRSMLAVLADVSQSRRMEEQLRQSQRLESMGRLAGGVAHDFNNVLTVVVANCDMLLEDVGEENPLRTAIGEIRESAKRGSSLTRQLLTFSRTQELNPAVVDLNSILERIEKLVRQLVGPDILLTMELTPDLPPVRVDPSQMEQVIMNLAVNARDAMPDGGRLKVRSGRVDVEEEDVRAQEGVPKGTYVLLSVRDAGIGMDEEVRARIFEPFFTTKEDGGTGLGLATVYGIVRESQGHLRVVSAPGEGSTFEVLFPHAAEAADSDQPEGITSARAPARP